MSVIRELIREESDGTLSFGDYELQEKKKLSDFSHKGDLYKVKTYNEITRLEKNEMFAYESVPGTAVEHLNATADEVSFNVEGPEDAEITLGLEPETEYDITVDGKDAGTMKTNLGGKLTLSVELENGRSIPVRAVRK